MARPASTYRSNKPSTHAGQGAQRRNSANSLVLQEQIEPAHTPEVKINDQPKKTVAIIDNPSSVFAAAALSVMSSTAG
jgi:hypothetical protein